MAHSLSPLFQNHFLQQRTENAVYLPFAVQPDDVAQALQGLHASQVIGVNVTVPHKESVLPLVDADADALAIGAANTLKRTATGWQACNTDWLGFSAVLDGLQAEVAASPVLLFGAGGTAKAVCHALAKQGVQRLLICNRSQHRAESLAADVLRLYPDMACDVLPWLEQDVATACQLCRTVINSSSVGLHEGDAFPFALVGQGVAVDAVYKPSGETAFGRAAIAGGYRAVDGLPMLIAQGIASFAYWHAEKLRDDGFSLPDKLQSLQWVEHQLGREPLSLPGWRT